MHISAHSHTWAFRGHTLYQNQKDMKRENLNINVKIILYYKKKITVWIIGALRGRNVIQSQNVWGTSKSATITIMKPTGHRL